ncbi:MAG: ABC transporter permease subunit [Candidatus Heimdallarchaeota archaeon]|nr:ABC transporter permease subunit [Candidatus Heimdallarchaeota archaeon]MCK4770051.1 ABC transporter permease subunit [Candidatus Heimdallarchaeota archaeon]
MRAIFSTQSKSFLFKEWKYIRRKILPLSIGLAIFGFLTVILLLALPYLADFLESLLPEVTPEMSIQSFMDSTNSIVSIIAVILCADAIAGEREQNTLVLIQTKPISPVTVILTKLAVRYLLVFISTIVGAIAVFFGTWAFIGLPDIVSFIISLVVYAFTLFAYLGIGMLISTIARSQISAGVISAVIILLITLISAFLLFEKFQPYNIFMMSVNLTTMEFTPTNIAVVCIVLFGLGSVFVTASVLAYYSEKEPTRKKV